MEEINELITKSVRHAIIFANSSVSTFVFHKTILCGDKDTGKLTDTQSPICPIRPTVIFETSKPRTKRIRNAYPEAKPHNAFPKKSV